MFRCTTAVLKHYTRALLDQASQNTETIPTLPRLFWAGIWLVSLPSPSGALNLDGLADWVVNSRGEPALGCSKGRKARPTVASTQGPNLFPSDGNPCVGMLDSSKSSVWIYHNLLWQSVLSESVCVWRCKCTRVYVCIYAHNVWCLCSLYLNYVNPMF